MRIGEGPLTSAHRMQLSEMQPSHRHDYERAKAASEKDRHRLYVEARTAEVAADNERLSQSVMVLQSLLEHSLDTTIRTPLLASCALQGGAFDPGPLARPEALPDPAQFQPPEPTGLGKHLGHANGSTSKPSNRVESPTSKPFRRVRLENPNASKDLWLLTQLIRLRRTKSE